MSLSSQETPLGGYAYIVKRLMWEFVDETPLSATDSAEIATAATFDNLAAVYPLVEVKDQNRKLVGTVVSIGGGYLLAAGHSVLQNSRPLFSDGKQAPPRLGLIPSAAPNLFTDELVDLKLVYVDFGDNIDLALLRVADIQDSQQLKFARLPAFQPRTTVSGMTKSVIEFGRCALFVGYGAMKKTVVASAMKKNDIAAFILNGNMASKNLSSLFQRGYFDTKPKKTSSADFGQLLLTMGSSDRYPSSNDSGGGLFILYEGKTYLVGIHFKTAKVGVDQVLRYPMYINLLSLGERIAEIVKLDRDNVVKAM